MTDKKMGRPKKYTEAQVVEAIGIVEGAGKEPTGDNVKEAMCKELGVSQGVNLQSLSSEVERLLADREREIRERRISALPPASISAANRISEVVNNAVLEHLGAQHEQLRAMNGKKLADARTDINTQREQMRALQSCIDEKDACIADLEIEIERLQIQLDATEKEASSLKGKVAQMNQESDLQAKVFNMLQDALARTGQVKQS
ncbi:hypothetical protein [Maritimibacter sp. UBA3975]|uniref:hypothetical protein n=1 Tax=Maritimibacter sp. UBA3975 TaxID=1946833 RepID=UPI000C0AF876|nr:hypothetical protein [Maritimibacter sp. UBA3975]MAM60458.1 hypothetical protein [Maritimibacter sp.]|tara:strand:+ start:32824 stop:33432 length:609 start_codon:yes stop_codon:yes gene_type:complete